MGTASDGRETTPKRPTHLAGSSNALACTETNPKHNVRATKANAYAGIRLPAARDMLPAAETATHTDAIRKICTQKTVIFCSEYVAETRDNCGRVLLSCVVPRDLGKDLRTRQNRRHFLSCTAVYTIVALCNWSNNTTSLRKSHWPVWRAS